MSWVEAFLSTSITLGEPLDDALAALGDQAEHVATLEATLRSGNRETRARALAQHLAPVIAALGELEARWHG